MKKNYEYYKTTRSICPKCRKVIPAKIVFYPHTKSTNSAQRNHSSNDNGFGVGVYMLKTCMEHGEFQSLIYRGKNKYIESLKINKPALYPLKYSIKDFKGCGNSCGLCPEHQQHTCLPIIEITDHCNMSCPICLADNHGKYYMPVSDF